MSFIQISSDLPFSSDFVEKLLHQRKLQTYMANSLHLELTQHESVDLYTSAAIDDKLPPAPGAQLHKH